MTQRAANVEDSAVSQSVHGMNEGGQNAEGVIRSTIHQNQKQEQLGIWAAVVLLAALAVVLIVVLNAREPDADRGSNGPFPVPAPSEVTATGVGPTTIKSLPSGPPDSIRRTQKDIHIAKLNGIDLDATEAEAKDWRYSPGSDQDDHDFTYSDNSNIIAFSVIVPGATKKSDCGVTGYANSIGKSEISRGAVICVKTTQKRIARIEVRDVDGERLVIDVMVWN
ncbi:hypothetical protein PV396_16935 [Streptomyces sp. ME02-8801-2C]|uniref:hypothetical protein n=1 Tax=Streptomyces sp. ME02-8801-2C TaxID=3028680 RepID=UPI0029A30A00|nr:hypothetical protein [Streptomyces sp. ME02-8801-2C]MDX3453617.1 hypothetical protein [Streptomyces sp. ME02-8801-2C]